jgi:hypothetical protein
MAGVLNQDWRTELAAAVPDFFAPRPGYPACLPECGAGWRWIIDRCAFRIGAALYDRESFRFERIREHQGSLRIYWGGRLSAGSEAAVREAIDLGEAASQCFCELCSAPGRLYRCNDVSQTRCAEHAQGVAVPIRPGFENLHLRQKVVTGRVRVVVRSRYESRLDRFIDLDPAGSGKEG